MALPRGSQNLGFFSLDQETDLLKNSLHNVILETIAPENDFLIDEVLDGEIVYSEIIDTEIGNIEQQFSNAKSWMVKWTTDRNYLEEEKSTTEFHVLGKGMIRYDPEVFYGAKSSSGRIIFDVELHVKKGKYKYKYSNFIHEADIFLRPPVNYGRISTDDICMTEKRIGMAKFKKVIVCERIAQLLEDSCNKMTASLKNTMEINAGDW